MKTIDLSTLTVPRDDGPLETFSEDPTAFLALVHAVKTVLTRRGVCLPFCIADVMYRHPFLGGHVGYDAEQKEDVVLERARLLAQRRTTHRAVPVVRAQGRPKGTRGPTRHAVFVPSLEEEDEPILSEEEARQMFREARDALMNEPEMVAHTEKLLTRFLRLACERGFFVKVPRPHTATLFATLPQEEQDALPQLPSRFFCSEEVAAQMAELVRVQEAKEAARLRCSHTDDEVE